MYRRVIVHRTRGLMTTTWPPLIPRSLSHNELLARSRLSTLHSGDDDFAISSIIRIKEPLRLVDVTAERREEESFPKHSEKTFPVPVRPSAPLSHVPLKIDHKALRVVVDKYQIINRCMILLLFPAGS